MIPYTLTASLVLFVYSASRQGDIIGGPPSPSYLVVSSENLVPDGPGMSLGDPKVTSGEASQGAQTSCSYILLDIHTGWKGM